jgi:hypothetical protein
MQIKTFAQFIAESTVDHIENIEIPDGSDKKLEADVAAGGSYEDDECPRCGEMPDTCTCPVDDFWSTQTYHRLPKGKVEKSKPKQEFKKG